jgi:hypothetical protein
MLFHGNFSVMIHTVAVWLTLSLAIWRFIMIQFPSKAVTLCTVSRCKVVLALGYGECSSLTRTRGGNVCLSTVVPFFLTVPNMFLVTMSSTLELRETGDSCSLLGSCPCHTLYRLQIADRGLNSELVFSLTMWLYSILLKLVPCLVLTIFTACLIRAMYKVPFTFITRPHFHHFISDQLYFAGS